MCNIKFEQLFSMIMIMIMIVILPAKSLSGGTALRPLPVAPCRWTAAPDSTNRSETAHTHAYGRGPMPWQGWASAPASTVIEIHESHKKNQLEMHTYVCMHACMYVCMYV